jgi:predicted RNase H-like HicB family nuclease
MSQATYVPDEDKTVFANIPWYQGFFSQWDNIEQARTNLLDAVQWVIFYKLSQWDKVLLKDMQQFLQQSEVSYA